MGPAFKGREDTGRGRDTEEKEKRRGK